MLPRTIDDRFVLEAEAAAGGMGTVFRGRDRATGQAVAIKVLRRARPTDQERFRREAAILAELDHPAIVGHVAHGVSGGAPYLVMRWIDGETLAARLGGAGVSIAETVTIARRTADALGAAHARGVVHRDVKPSNLMFPGGDLTATTLVDFGVARTTARGGSLTATGSVVGTPSYMAPEQVRGGHDVGPPADVFALGCVLYECLTGRLAFEGLRFLALRAKILRWEPPPVRALAPDVPAELDALIRAMLAKAPEDRPADGAALAARLAALPPPGPAGTIRRSRHTDAPTAIERPAGSPTCAPRALSLVVAASPDAADEPMAPGGGGAGLADDGDGADAPAAPLGDGADAPGGLTLAPAARGALEHALAGDGALLDVLDDGALVVTLADAAPAPEQARRALRCARAVRRALPDALIAVASGEAHPGDEGALIDAAVAALARDAALVVFAGVAAPDLPDGAIRVDDRTLALIAPAAAAVHIQGACYLPGAETP